MSAFSQAGVETKQDFLCVGVSALASLFFREIYSALTKSSEGLKTG